MLVAAAAAGECPAGWRAGVAHLDAARSWRDPPLPHGVLGGNGGDLIQRQGNFCQCRDYGAANGLAIAKFLFLRIFDFLSYMNDI